MSQFTPLDPAVVDTIASAANPARRATISEMNAMNMDQLAASLRDRQYDDRSVVTRALDVLDLPGNVIRNTVASVIAPGAIRTARERGEFAGAGLPRVNTSDILRALGVKNQIVNAVVGFAGDVALDPLTYLGPAGGAIRVTTSAGRSLQFGRAGAKALRRGIRAASRGEEVANPVVRDLLDATRTVINSSPENAQRLANAKTPEAIEAILREFTTGVAPPATVAGRAGQTLAPVLGFDSSFQATTNSVLAKYLDDAAFTSIDTTLPAAERAAALSVRAFARRYGKAATEAPFREVGFRFGNGGSQIAHIPFTEFGVAVPAFSKYGRQATTVQQIANAGEYAVEGIRPQDIAAFAGATSVAPKIAEAGEQIRVGIVNARELTDQYATLAAQMADATPETLPELTRQADEIRAAAEDAINATKGVLARLNPADATTPESAAEMLYQMKLVEAANTEGRALEYAARAAKEENVEAARIIRAEIDARINNLTKQIEQGDLSGLPDIPQVPVTLKAFEDDIEATMPGLLKRDITVAASERASQGGRFGLAETSARQLGRDDIAIKAFALRTREQMAANLRAGVNAGLGDEAIDDYYGRLTSFPASDAKPGDTFRLYDYQAEVVQADAAGVEIQLRDIYKSDREPIFFNVPMTGVLPGIEGTHSRSQLAGEVRKALDKGEIPQAIMDRVRQHVRNKEIAQADESLRGMLALSDAAFAAKNDIIPRLLQDRAELLLRRANYLQAPIERVASMTGDKALVQLGRFLLQTDDASIAVSPFGTIGQALEDHKRFPAVSRTARDFDRWTRKNFGIRAGAVHENARKNIRSVSDDGYRRTMTRASTHMVHDLHAALRSADLPDKHIGLASRGLLARMVLLKQSQGAYFAKALVRENGVLKEVDHPILATLNELGSLNSPKFIQQLDTLAAKYVTLLDDIGREAVHRGILAHTLRGNIPNRFHGPAKETLGRAQRSKDLDDIAATIGSTGERTSKQYRFTDENGELHRVFDWDLSARPVDDNEFLALNPAQQDAVALRQKSVKAWKERVKADGLSEAEAFRRYGKDTDPFEFNALAEAGAIYAIAEGGRPVLEDAVMLLSARMADHHRAMSLAQFHEHIREWGIDVYTKSIQHTSPGGAIRLDSGDEVLITTRKGRDGKEVLGFERNGLFYRTLNKPLVNASELDLLNKGADPDLLTRAYPEQVADIIEGIHGIFASPQMTNDLLLGVDQLTRLWKTTTLMHPSWVVSNVFGSTALLMQAGMNMPKFFKNMAGALKTVFAHDPEKVADLTIGSQSAQDMVRHLHENHVTAGFLRNTTADEILLQNMSVLASDHMAPHGLRATLRHPKQAFAKLGAKADEIILNKELARNADIDIARQIAEERAGNRAYKGFVMGSTALSTAVKTWFRMNQRLEDAFRLAAMATWMDEGLDAAEAGHRTKTALFDYLDFTQTESHLRRFLPFYSWLKNNLAFQARQLIYRPVQAAMTPKLLEAVEQLTAGENQVPLHLRPRWMAEQLAVQMGANPDARWSLGVADMLPSADIAANWAPALLGGVEGVQHSANRIVAGINPVLRAPVEFAAGQEFFTGRSIGPDATTGDLSAVEFAASQVRPLREFGVLSNRKGPIQRAAEQGPSALAARAVLGGRAQDFSEERIRAAKLREYLQREEQLRQVVIRNHTNGFDTLGPRADLMALYTQMLRDGYGDEVPRWAQDQIELLVEP